MIRFILLILVILLLVGCGEERVIVPNDLQTAGRLCDNNGGVKFFHIGGFGWYSADTVTGVTCVNGAYFGLDSFKENIDE